MYKRQAFILFPVIISADDDLIQDSQSDAGLSANTSLGVTTANVTLTESLHNDAVSEVTSIVSNLTSASVDNVTMTADSYVTATNQLTVGSLTANQTGRGLTIVYDYGALDTYTGMESIALIAPVVIFAVMLFGGGLLTWTGMKGK